MLYLYVEIYAALGLGDYRRVSESSSSASAFPIPPGKFSLPELDNSSSRVKFAGFPFNLELSPHFRLTLQLYFLGLRRHVFRKYSACVINMAPSL